MGVEENLLG